MNIQIITSSYPSFKGDPLGTAGLFVESFANELVSQGHTVVVQPVARRKSYHTETGVIIEPIPWGGGDQELASMTFLNPLNWLTFLTFFLNGKKHTSETHRKYKIDRTLCMWIIPCGIFGYWIYKYFDKKYDIWALGSDIWKVRKIPFFGKYWIKKVVQNASGVFADGLKLADDVKKIALKDCLFLPSTRKLPKPESNLTPLQPTSACHLLFVGRYHKNKGPDLLVRAISEIPKNKRQNLRVHFFGIGPLEQTLREMRKRLRLDDIITINGPINEQEFANYLSQVSFLVISSRIESIPLVFSDALQAGTPVISMPVGDLPDIIEQEECGLVCRQRNSKSLANCIEEAIGLKKDKFSRQQILTAYEHFDIRRTVERWLENSE